MRFTFRDCVVLCAVLPLTGVALVQAVATPEEISRRQQCAMNLRQIAVGIMFYTQDVNTSRFPRTTYDPKSPETVNAYTGWRSPDPFKPDGPKPNDVTGPLYLLLRTDYVKPEQFICPSSGKTPLKFGGGADALAPSPKDLSNFPSPQHLSYSMTNPYPTQAAVKAGLKLTRVIESEFIIAGDMNPGGAALATATYAQARKDASWQPPGAPPDALQPLLSPNHGHEGMNFAFPDTHVEWTKQPFAGLKRPKGDPDNVYTRFLPKGAKGDAVVGPSMDQYDAVLLPTAQMNAPEDPAKPEAQRSGAPDRKGGA